MNNKILLQIENICKTFGNTKAVNNVSFNIYKNEIRGIIGENGSGKSTLVSMLAGIQGIDSGKFVLEGKEIISSNQVDANEKGISIIVQEMGTLNGLTVAENIFLGNEKDFVKCGFRNIYNMNKTANELLTKYGFDYIKASEIIDMYDFEKRKLVELVKATYFNPKILIVDETTTALSQDGRMILYKYIKKIKDAGNAVIFISHDLEEVIELTDTITVLRDGEYVDTVNTADISQDDLKRLMVGREIDKKYYREDYNQKVSDEVTLEVKNISVPNQLYDISFELHKGEILGIGGLSDCGIHEIGKAIFGASYDRTGTIRLASGAKINNIPSAIKNGMAYASKDRDNESLIINSSINDNICLPSLNKINKKGILTHKKEKKFSNKYAELMNVKMENVEQFVSALSGGNKQKVVLAKWVGKDSDILILDSPKRGIDIKVKAAIYSLLEEFKKQGKSIVMISEEIMELIGMSDRILIFKQGKINAEFKRDINLSEKDLIKEMI